MVEIVKDENANDFTNPAVLPAQSVPLQPCVELIVDRNQTVEKAHIFSIVSRSLNINFFFYAAIAAMAGVLFTPQVRGFFIQIGLRWVHVLCLSFALSFCLNPVFAGIARKLNILDRPDARKLHSEATPLLGGAAVFIGFGV